MLGGMEMGNWGGAEWMLCKAAPGRPSRFCSGVVGGLGVCVCERERERETDRQTDINL